jgi:hypothetical protein
MTWPPCVTGQARPGYRPYWSSGAKLLLLAAEGASNTEIAERLGISRPTVIAWRKRYVREGCWDSWPTALVAPDQRPPAPATLPVVADARSLRQCHGGHAVRTQRQLREHGRPRTLLRPPRPLLHSPAGTRSGRVVCAGQPARSAWVGGQGLVGLRPELQAVDPLTATLAMVDVRWAYLDEASTARQHSRYLLRRSDSGQLAIQVRLHAHPA